MGNADAVQMVVEERIKPASFFSDNFYVWQFFFNSVLSYFHLSPTERYEPESVSKDSGFVLRGIDIYHKLFTMR